MRLGTVNARKVESNLWNTAISIFKINRTSLSLMPSSLIICLSSSTLHRMCDAV